MIIAKNYYLWCMLNKEYINKGNMEYVKMNLDDYKDMLFRAENHKDEISDLYDKISKLSNKETFIFSRGFFSQDVKYYSLDDSVLDLLKEIDIRDEQIKSLKGFKKSITSKWYHKLFHLCN